MKTSLLTENRTRESPLELTPASIVQNPSKRQGLVARAFRYVTQFSVSTYFWISLLSAVLVLWHLDRRQLEQQLGLMNGVESPAWSIDQVMGFPDTAAYGDVSTAWASATQNASEEWMVVEFPLTVSAAGIDVYETYNPGAIAQVYSVAMDGTERLLWEGRDPLKGKASGGGIAKIRFPQNERTRRLKIVLDSAGVPGWNEVDAIALIDESGNKQWVTRAWASSSYGKNNEVPSWFWP